MQFRDKTAYVCGLRSRWDPLLSMSPARRLPHFLPPHHKHTLKLLYVVITLFTRTTRPKFWLLPTRQCRLHHLLSFFYPKIFFTVLLFSSVLLLGKWFPDQGKNLLPKVFIVKYFNARLCEHYSQNPFHKAKYSLAHWCKLHQLEIRLACTGFQSSWTQPWKKSDFFSNYKYIENQPVAGRKCTNRLVKLFPLREINIYYDKD